MDNDDATTYADSVTPICKSLDGLTEVDADKIYPSDANVEHNQDDIDTEPIHSKLGIMAGHEQLHKRDTELTTIFHKDDNADSVTSKRLTEVANCLVSLEKTFHIETSQIQTQIDNIISRNEEVARELGITVDPLKKELSDVGSEFATLRDTHLKEIEDFNKEMKAFEERLKDDSHKLDEKAKVLNDKMSKQHKHSDDLDKIIIANKRRWASLMHADEREQTKAKLSEQNRLLGILKDERNFRNDRWKEFMKEVQSAKEKEVKDLNDKLNEADRLIRALISEHKDEISQSENILSSEIASLEKEKEALAKERDRLKNSGDSANNSLLRNRIEYLNAEVQKRDDYILIQEDRLRKTREAAALFNELNARDYEKYRQFYRSWQDVDRKLNERSSGIKQSFQQGDGKSLVDTLTWIKTTIERIPGNCIHANNFQRMTGIIHNAIRGDYSGTQTYMAFQQEPNCVLQ